MVVSLLIAQAATRPPYAVDASLGVQILTGFLGFITATVLWGIRVELRLSKLADESKNLKAVISEMKIDLRAVLQAQNTTGQQAAVTAANVEGLKATSAQILESLREIRVVKLKGISES